MACFAPLTGYYSSELNPETGKRSLVFDQRKAHSGCPIRVPCGVCIGCRKSAATQWGVRCFHEQIVHGFECGSFLTLTYDDNSIPPDWSVSVRTLQLFIKRLRKSRGNGIRYFGCGEYGDVTGRPHYHVLLFNCVFPDMQFWKYSTSGYSLFRSDELSDLWTFGFIDIGIVTAQSCMYVCKYMMKAEDHLGRAPPFRVMSRRPGLGYEYFSRYGLQAYKHDNCIIDGIKHSLPRYYDGLELRIDTKRLDEVKRLRRLAKMLPESRFNNTPERRRVREAYEVLTKRKRDT